MTNQDQVLAYLKTVPEANKQAIYDNVEFGYYHNWEKHLGDVLARMVKNNKIERVKKGIYQIRTQHIKSDMPTLF